VALALRHALRLTVIAFADYLGVAQRTVSKWEARRNTITLRTDYQAIMDTALSRTTPDQRDRFTRLRQQKAD
jgi:transcriptional regulator with XRE-family HTH domain